MNSRTPASCLILDHTGDPAERRDEDDTLATWHERLDDALRLPETGQALRVAADLAEQFAVEAPDLVRRLICSDRAGESAGGDRRVRDLTSHAQQVLADHLRDDRRPIDSAYLFETWVTAIDAAHLRRDAPDRDRVRAQVALRSLYWYAELPAAP